MSSARLLGFVAFMSAGAGCASAEVVPAATHTTAATIEAPAKKEAAVPPLKRDAALAGNEHKVSMLEGRIVTKLHAVETPKVETHASPTKGILYTTIQAKLGEGQTVYCTAFDERLFPASLAAADLRGEHDWGDDGIEKSDTVAKTTTEVTALDVSVVGGRPVLSARGSVHDEAGTLVADRKVIVTSSAAFTLACSDRTVGFDKRFHAFASEVLGSLTLDPPPSPAPKRVVIYKMQSEGKTIGYYELVTYAEPKGGTKTFGTEIALDVSGGKINGVDTTAYAVANARGGESDIRLHNVVNNETTVHVKAARDAKGWSVKLGADRLDVVSKRMSAKTGLTSLMMPGWMSRMQAAATSKKAAPVKIPLVAVAEKPAVAVAKRQADGSVTYVEKGNETRATFDADGLASWSTFGAKYDRIFAEGAR
ncbi:MAG: hypothetical protein KIT84_25850 [Labilithrix sp.]|nr:hypothetical protein [Labilithrix sp.]MCW5814478.1 hypothetical protein [Labilithrix sp.]